MPHPSFDREAIEAEIDRVRALGLDELRTLWLGYLLRKLVAPRHFQTE